MGSGATAGMSMSGGTGGTTGGSDPSGGNGGSMEAGSGGTGGSGGSGMTVDCEGPTNELTIDGSHWMERDCNDFDIQGAWYCYDDGLSDSDCEDKPRWDTDLKGYCFSGTTIVSADAWGAGVGIELNADPVDGKDFYDAAAKNIVGFAITVEGVSGTALHVNFTDEVMEKDVPPFIEYSPLGNETRVLEAYINEADVPATWDVPNAGQTVDPAKIMDIQVAVVGGDDEEPFEICITHVKPILLGTD